LTEAREPQKALASHPRGSQLDDVRLIAPIFG
jgi:hypothetical protein